MHRAFSKVPTHFRPLSHKVVYNFGIRQKIINNLQSGSIYRAIGILASVQIFGMVLQSKMLAKQVTLSISDYFKNSFIKENQQYQIAGILKPGSFSVKRGTLETKFTLTDFENEVDVFYKGATKFEFKEGETLILTAYTPDLANRKKVVGIDYLTKHSMDGTNWADSVNLSRESFGVNTRTQAML